MRPSRFGSRFILRLIRRPEDRAPRPRRSCRFWPTRLQALSARARRQPTQTAGGNVHARRPAGVTWPTGPAAGRVHSRRGSDATPSGSLTGSAGPPLHRAGPILELAAHDPPRGRSVRPSARSDHGRAAGARTAECRHARLRSTRSPVRAGAVLGPLRSLVAVRAQPRTLRPAAPAPPAATLPATADTHTGGGAWKRSRRSRAPPRRGSGRSASIIRQLPPGPRSLHRPRFRDVVLRGRPGRPLWSDASSAAPLRDSRPASLRSVPLRHRPRPLRARVEAGPCAARRASPCSSALFRLSAGPWVERRLPAAGTTRTAARAARRARHSGRAARLPHRLPAREDAARGSATSWTSARWVTIPSPRCWS
mgnify:CR=1 FL=1